MPTRRVRRNQHRTVEYPTGTQTGHTQHTAPTHTVRPSHADNTSTRPARGQHPAQYTSATNSKRKKNNENQANKHRSNKNSSNNESSNNKANQQIQQNYQQQKQQQQKQEHKRLIFSSEFQSATDFGSNVLGITNVVAFWKVKRNKNGRSSGLVGGSRRTSTIFW